MRIFDYGLIALLVLMGIYAFQIFREQCREDRARAARMDEAIKGAPLTQRNIQAWSHLRPRDAAERELEWTAMLERRVAQLDPQYQAYQWGLQPPTELAAGSEGK